MAGLVPGPSTSARRSDLPRCWRPIELDRHCEERSDEATQGPRQTAPGLTDVSCASFPPTTAQGVARRIDLFRKVVRSALIGVHSLDQIDVGRANFLFGRSRLQTENSPTLWRRSCSRRESSRARLPAVWLSPPPVPTVAVRRRLSAFSMRPARQRACGLPHLVADATVAAGAPAPKAPCTEGLPLR